MTCIRQLTRTLLVLGALLPSVVAAQEPATCLLQDSRQFPQPSKPYVLIIADTSGSMTAAVAGATSCGFGSDRRAHQRCAIRNAIQAYSGVANFGLMTFAMRQTGCGAACFGTCAYSSYPGEVTAIGCGPGTGANRRGGFIQVPMLQDSFWTTPPPPDNTLALDGWTDNTCTGNTELFSATGANSPLNGALRDALLYFSSTGWTAQDMSVTYPTPFATQDLGTGGSGCRRARVVLISDGNDVCDVATDAQAAATALAAGVTVGGNTFPIRVNVLSFAGAAIADLDAIAAAGGTSASVIVNNEADLQRELGAIVRSLASPERCDNLDNDCNGCTDEGFDHFGNVGQTCCAWATPAQRTSCLNLYFASIVPANPLGNRAQLPCVTAAQAVAPATWSCYDPGEICDNVDNNLNGATDEGFRKCGSPLHCPEAETCDGEDDDCDGVVDNGACPGGGVALPETCNGCDDDLDGTVDDGAASVACGTPSPANCPGAALCKPPVAAPAPGGCVAGAGFNACTNNPQTETCDGIDNDCDSIVDDNVPAVQCTPAGTPATLVFGGTSQCTRGSQSCGGACIGFVGPSGEVTDTIDNDCDGIIDNIFLFRDGFE